MPDKVSQIEKSFKKVEEDVARQCALLSAELGNIPCYHLSLNWCHQNIDGDLVDEVFDELRSRFPDGKNQELAVIVSSGGGDIDSAYAVVIKSS